MWQEIFDGYEGINLFRVYHSLINKIHKTQDIDIDKGCFYNKSKINLSEFTYVEWENLNDFLFVNPLEFDENIANANTLSASISERKDVNLSQLGKKKNDVAAKKDSSATNSKDNDNKSALISIPNYIKSLP